MPSLISQPEALFREHGKDLQVIGYRETETLKGKKAEAAYRKAQVSLKMWFKINLPETKLSIVGPSEYSGWIIGGPCYYIADLTSEALAAFNKAWGSDSQWYVYDWPVAEWRKRVESAALLASPIDRPRMLNWWEMPSGFIFLSGCCDGRLLSRRDAWWRLQQLLPEYAGLELDTFLHGAYEPYMGVEKCIHWIYMDWNDISGLLAAEKYLKDVDAMRRLRSALAIADDAHVKISLDDF